MTMWLQADGSPTPPAIVHIATAGPAQPAPSVVAPATGCNTGTSADIVVCGTRSSNPYRLKPLPPLPPSHGLKVRLIDVELLPRLHLIAGPGGMGLGYSFGGPKQAPRPRERHYAPIGDMLPKPPADSAPAATGAQRPVKP